MNATLKHKAPAVKYRTKNDEPLAAIANRHEYKLLIIKIAGDEYKSMILKETKPIEVEPVDSLAFPDSKFIYKSEKNRVFFDTEEYSEYFFKQHPVITFGKVIALYREGVWHIVDKDIGREDIAAMVVQDLTRHGVKPFNTKTSTITEIVNFIKRKPRTTKHPFLNVTNEFLVNFKNGIYDMEHNQFWEHSPKHRINYQVPYELDLNDVAFPNEVSTPETDRMLDMLFKEDAAYMWAWLGYSFVRSNANWQLLTFLYGIPGNGKSTFQRNFLNKLFGMENIGALDEKQLTKDAKFNLINLQDKFVNISSDMTGEFNKEWTILKRVSGGDIVEVEAKQVQATQMVNTASLLFVTNVYPQMALDEGVNRRIQIVEMRTPSLKTDELKKQYAINWQKVWDEIPHVAFKAIRYYMAHKDNPLPPVSEHMEQQKEQFKKDANPVSRFVTEHLTPDEPDRGVSIKYLYEKYVDEMKYNGMKHFSQIKFQREIAALHYQVEKEQTHGSDYNGQRLTRVLGWQYETPSSTL